MKNAPQRDRPFPCPFLLLFGRFLPPNQAQAVDSKVLVSFCGTLFPSFLVEESGSFSYYRDRDRFRTIGTPEDSFDDRRGCSFFFFF